MNRQFGPDQHNLIAKLKPKPDQKYPRTWIPGHDGLREFACEKKSMLLSVLMALGILALDLLKPWPLAWILDRLYQNQSPEDFNLKTAMLALGTLLLINSSRSILGAWREFFIIRVGLRGLRRIRARFFSTLLMWDAKEAQERDTEKTLYNAAWDTYSFQTQYQQWVGSLVESVLSLLGMSIIMWLVQPRLAWIPMCAAPITLIWLKYAGVSMTQAGKQARESDAVVTQTMGKAIHYLSLIQLFHQETQQKKNFQEQSTQSENWRLFQHQKEIVYSAGVGLVFGFLTVAVVGLGAYLILQEKLTPGELLVFLAYVSQWYSPLNQISQFGATNADAQAGIQRVYSAMEPKSPTLSQQNAIVVTERSPRLNPPWTLEWKNLRFQYPEGPELFHGISGKLETGRILVCRGVSGIGKSTLARVLTRWIECQDGRISLQGVDIREWSLDLLRRQFSWAPQQALIWPGTIRENLDLALPLEHNPDFDANRDRDDAYLAVLSQVEAGPWIRTLSDGLNTRVGDSGGLTLSAGERQKLCLARALLKSSPFLILDEPTSSVDEITARKMVKSVQALKGDRAILVISHQPMWWEAADEVMEMSPLNENGLVIPG